MKKRLAIITDSSCGNEFKNIQDCFHMPLLLIEKNKNEIIEYKDLVDISIDQVFQKLEENKNLSTSQINFGEALELVESILKKYEYVFVIGLSKGLSGSYNTWLQIKDEVNSDNLQIIDSNEVACGVPELIKQVQDLFLKKKKSIKQIHEFVNKWNNRRQAQLIVNDMDALIKGGRVSALKGKIAKLLHLKISITFNGKLTFLDKSKDLEKIVDLSLKSINSNIDIKNKGIEKIYYFFNKSDDNFEEFNKFKKICIEWLENNSIKFNKSKIDELILPSVITVHTGLNSYGIWVLANE